MDENRISDTPGTKKFIQRIRKSNDRRAIEPVITDDGKAILQKHIQEDKLFIRSLYSSLPLERNKQLLELLDELLRKVNKENRFYENK